MPTYDYVCKACDHRFEHFQTMTSDLLTTCPECEQDELKRLIGAGAALIFKGSGFYCTDYKDKSPSPDARVERAKDAAKHVKETSGGGGGDGGGGDSGGSGGGGSDNSTSAA